MKLSVVVPCYNEKASIKDFYEQLTKMLKKEKITYEIIFIDDGSYDNSLKIIKKLLKKIKGLDLFHFLEILEKKQVCMLV